MRLPITDEVVEQELLGAMSIVTNVYGSPIHRYMGPITLQEAGVTEEGYTWETDDGALRIMDVSDTCLYEFRALETKNGCVYLIGDSLSNERKGQRERVILHQSVPFSDRKSAVCISTHHKYREHTLPVILKSLKKAAFDMSRVYVSVAACSKQTNYEENGVQYRELTGDYHGFTALPVAAVEEKEVDYWFLLHDTCAVDADFSAKLSGIDVGLNPDMVLFRKPSENLEIGLYHSDFLAAVVSELPRVGPSRALDGFVANARIAIVLDCNVRDEGQKDIYGNGTSRKILSMPSVGVRKFKAKAADGGKP